MLKKIVSKCFTTSALKKDQIEPIRIAVTGANGNIGYATVFRIAKGDLLGPKQPVILHLIDLPNFQSGLKGIAMELNDCAFPLLREVIACDNLASGFKDIDIALLIGSKPRGPGMERSDLLKDNGRIFIDTGKALNDHAKRTAKILVVGNPANTNCLIAQHYAPDIPKENFTAMTRLDHNRGVYQLASKLNAELGAVKKFCIWGNHSPTMFPDVSNVVVNSTDVYSQLGQEWINNEFIPKVQQRGTEVINARKQSSAASAANAAISHVHDWINGTKKHWTSMGVYSSGEYGVKEGLIFSFPVTTDGGKWSIVKDLKLKPEVLEKIKVTEEELIKEREIISELIK